MFRFCTLFLTVSFAFPAGAEIAGPLRVIDADTFDIGGTRVRLFGIDAPEMGQPCVTANAEVRDCGKWASDMVAARFAGAPTTCQSLETDRYGRVVATCNAEGEDIGAVLVGEGWAWAYRQYAMDYDLVEKQAAVANRGLWAFEIARPDDWRAAQVTPAVAPDAGCTIKGNISNSGRVYHLPHNRDYGRTQINISKGERWFCTEAEAQAAGWRAARN